MLGISDLGRYVSGGCAAVAILTGCGGSGGTQVAPTVPTLQTTTRRAFNAVRPDSIVYTPVNKTIEDNGSLGLDLNNDRTNDFTLTQSQFRKYEDWQTGQPCGFHVILSLSPSQSGNGAASGAHLGWAGDLRKGRRINSRLYFYTGSSLLADVSLNNGYPFCEGPKNWDYGYWWGSGTRYLGLEFQIRGQMHYGWAEVGTSSNRGFDVYTTLAGYAYQTIAGKSIRAGQTK